MARFFRLSGEVGRLNSVDTLLHRYPQGLEILKLSPRESITYIRACAEGELDDRIFELWLAFVPNMRKETYVGYSDFKDSLTGANIDQRPTDEILAEAEEIKRRFADGSESI